MLFFKEEIFLLENFNRLQNYDFVFKEIGRFCKNYRDNNSELIGGSRTEISWIKINYLGFLLIKMLTI